MVTVDSPATEYNSSGHTLGPEVNAARETGPRTNTVAGMLNLLAMIDAAHRAAHAQADEPPNTPVGATAGAQPEAN